MMLRMKDRILWCVLAGLMVGSLLADDFVTMESVGRHGGSVVTPVNQVVTPAGVVVE